MPKAGKPRKRLPPVPASCAWLARSRNLKHLWIARMLVRQGAMKALGDDAVRAELRMPQVKRDDDEGAELMRDELAIALRHMETHASRFRLNRVLEANLDLLSRQFGLTLAERMALAFAVSWTSDDVLHRVADGAQSSVDPAWQSATILGLPVLDVERAISPAGRLNRTGLIQIGNNTTPNGSLAPGRGRLRALTRRRLASAEELAQSFARPGVPCTLTREDFVHLRPRIGFIVDLLTEALRKRRSGVNILLHGAPGTGKTECARLLARELDVPLYEVSSMDADFDMDGPIQRLQSAAKVQLLLGRRRALVLFDEIDAAFDDGLTAGKRDSAKLVKAWVNDLLEKNAVPAIWIANSICGMDPAFVRRFDLVVSMESPPQRQRERMLENCCDGVLDAAQIRRFAHVRSATPAVVARAVDVVRRVACGAQSRADLLETVLDGTLLAQGHASVRRSVQGQPVEDYDIGLCNADADLPTLVAGLARTGAGRVCLYGPPGTGKTAFGHWLARSLDRPLVLKRASDLQSPYIGVMEKNLARAFEEAARERAVLQIDEIDTFLQERRGAQHHWEVSQVNEFLTQLESCEGVLIASTNLMDGLDRAALRRFDYKIRMDYLRPVQAWLMFERLVRTWNLACASPEEFQSRLARLTRLTPGDFSVVQRRHAVVPFPDVHAVLEALRCETSMKEHESRPIGFVRAEC